MIGTVSFVFLYPIIAIFTPVKKESYTPNQALPKIKYYCAYQERCHHEVKEKLYGFALHKNDVEIIMATLVAENYLNEQRFAEIFAGSKFRLKHWGKVKIRYELKQKFVSDYCIRKALFAIDLDDYEKVLEDLAQQKWQSLSGEKNIFTKKRKVLNYLMQKGFEADLCKTAISKLTG